MSRLFIIVLSISLLFSFTLSACSNPVKGSGELRTQDFSFADFSSVEVEGPFEVSISRANSYNVTIMADENIFERITVSKQDKVF